MKCVHVVSGLAMMLVVAAGCSPGRSTGEAPDAATLPDDANLASGDAAIDGASGDAAIDAGVVTPGKLRGRVKVKNGTVVADDGTPLRLGSARLRPSEYPYVADESFWQKMHDEGHFNGIRIMIYDNDFSDVTALLSQLDTAVRNASESGMYVMIDNHKECCDNMNITADSPLWAAIAPRYAKNTNVIYEIKNEPNQYDNGLPAYEDSMYKLIRAAAPDTHIVAWSFCCTMALSQSTELGYFSKATAIDYTNASVGFHPYNTIPNGGVAALAARLKAFQAQGLPVVMTEYEVFPKDTGIPSELLGALEPAGISWTLYDYTGIWTAGFTLGSAHNYEMTVTWPGD